MFKSCLKITFIIFSVLIGSLLQHVSAQTTPAGNITINGQVLDDYGRPLKNVLVQVKSARQSASTQNNGRFTIQAGVSEILVFSHPAFNTFEIKIKNNTDLLIKLSDRYLHAPTGDTGAVNNPELQTIDVLYGKTTAEKMLGAVATVYSNQLSTTPGSLYAYALPGRLA